MLDVARMRAHARYIKSFRYSMASSVSVFFHGWKVVASIRVRSWLRYEAMCWLSLFSFVCARIVVAVQCIARNNPTSTCLGGMFCCGCGSHWSSCWR